MIFIMTLQEDVETRFDTSIYDVNRLSHEGKN